MFIVLSLDWVHGLLYWTEMHSVHQWQEMPLSSIAGKKHLM